MTDSRYNDAWGMRYEGHRVLLSRDFWMSVGFVAGDFEDRSTWQAALRRGPVNGRVSPTTTMRSEETVIPIEVGSEEDSIGMVEMFPELKEPLEIDVEDCVPLDYYMDIGTPTFPGIEYDAFDMDIDLTAHEVFEDESKTAEDDVVCIDMNSKGVTGVNLGEFVTNSQAGRFVFRPIRPNTPL
jgi:hypothetical protein